MGFVVAVTFGFIVWIILWSINVKPIDAFIPTVVIVLLAATAQFLSRHLGRRES
jgi:uncharacterized membrane protein